MKTTVSVSLAALLATFCLHSQNPEKPHWEYRIAAGLNYGGTSPFPIPNSIQQIDNWRPSLNPQVFTYAIRWLNPTSAWGVAVGMGASIKGMEASAMVHLMPTELVLDSDTKIAGLFTGNNRTRIRNGYIVLPVQLAYRPTKRFLFQMGVYAAYTAQQTFQGTVSDGYFRVGDIKGDVLKIVATSYDFSDQIRGYDLGFASDMHVNLVQKISANLHLSWGAISIFPQAFKGIDYNMYNIYLSVGGSYLF